MASVEVISLGKLPNLATFDHVFISDLCTTGLSILSSNQEVGSEAFQLFEQGQVRAALEMADHLLVPALKAVAEYPCAGDDSVVEKVREEWCNCLMHPSLSESELTVHCIAYPSVC